MQEEREKTRGKKKVSERGQEEKYFFSLLSHFNFNDKDMEMQIIFSINFEEL